VKIGNFQGLFCENSGHIHNYVYILEDICAKAAEWTGSRVSNRSRGVFSKICKTQMRSRRFRRTQGVICKVAFIFFLAFNRKGQGLPLALANDGAGVLGSGVSSGWFGMQRRGRGS
jgi:hypothetical protein